MKVKEIYMGNKPLESIVTTDKKILNRVVQMLRERKDQSCYDMFNNPKWTKGLDLSECMELTELMQQYCYGDITMVKREDWIAEYDYSEEILWINQELNKYQQIVRDYCTKDNLYDFIKLQGVFYYLDTQRADFDEMYNSLIKELGELPKCNTTFASLSEIADDYDDLVHFKSSQNKKEYIIACNRNKEISLFVKDIN